MASRYPSSRELADELRALKGTTDAFVYGNGEGNTKGGCATATFGADRAELLDMAKRLQSLMKKVMAQQPPLPAADASPSYSPSATSPLRNDASNNSSNRFSSSPTRRQQQPTNSAATLEHMPSELHKAHHHQGYDAAAHPFSTSTIALAAVATRGHSPSSSPNSHAYQQQRSRSSSPSNSISRIRNAAAAAAAAQRPSESLAEIARQYSVTVSELRAFNPNLASYADDERLPPHSPVRVPTHGNPSPDRAAPAVAAAASPPRQQSAAASPLSAGRTGRAVVTSDVNGGQRSPTGAALAASASYCGAMSPSYNEAGPASATTPQRAYVAFGGSGSSPQQQIATPFHTSSTSAPYNAPVDRALDGSLHAAPPLPVLLADEAQMSQRPQRETNECDSVWSLAKEYDVPVRELLRLNPQLRNFNVNEVLPPQLIVAVPIVL